MEIKHVVAAVILEKGCVLATQRGYGEYKDFWEFPGGKIEAGETPEEALMREIREEMACDVDVKEKIGTIEYDYPSFHLSMGCYRCELRPGTQPKLLEHEAARWLTAETIEDVEWLPADLSILDDIRRYL